MTYDKWAINRLSKGLRCRVLDSMSCIPLRDDPTCRSCFEDEKEYGETSKQTEVKWEFNRPALLYQAAGSLPTDKAVKYLEHGAEMERMLHRSHKWIMEKLQEGEPEDTDIAGDLCRFVLTGKLEGG